MVKKASFGDMHVSSLKSCSFSVALHPEHNGLQFVPITGKFVAQADFVIITMSYEKLLLINSASHTSQPYSPTADILIH